MSLTLCPQVLVDDYCFPNGQETPTISLTTTTPSLPSGVQDLSVETITGGAVSLVWQPPLDRGACHSH
jgi:hypothetical protein